MGKWQRRLWVGFLAAAVLAALRLWYIFAHGYR